MAANDLNFFKVIRFLYYFLLGFNLFLGILIIITFSDFKDTSLFTLLHQSFTLFIPVFILDTLADFKDYFMSNLRKILHRLFIWVVNYNPKLGDAIERVGGVTLDQVNSTVPEPKMDNSFRLKAGGEKDLDDLYDFYSPGEDLDNKPISWKTITVLVIIGLGISYYYNPDLYHGIFNKLKDLYSNTWGGGGRDPGLRPGGGTTGTTGSSTGTTGSSTVTTTSSNLSKQSLPGVNFPKTSAQPQGIIPEFFKPVSFGKEQGYIWKESFFNTSNPMENLKSRMETIAFSDINSSDKSFAMRKLLKAIAADKSVNDLNTFQRTEFFYGIFNDLKVSVAKNPTIPPLDLDLPSRMPGGIFSVDAQSTLTLRTAQMDSNLPPITQGSVTVPTGTHVSFNSPTDDPSISGSTTPTGDLTPKSPSVVLPSTVNIESPIPSRSGLSFKPFLDKGKGVDKGEISWAKDSFKGIFSPKPTSPYGNFSDNQSFSKAKAPESLSRNYLELLYPPSPDPSSVPLPVSKSPSPAQATSPFHTSTSSSPNTVQASSNIGRSTSLPNTFKSPLVDFSDKDALKMLNEMMEKYNKSIKR